jgi:hypothetical protein
MYSCDGCGEEKKKENSNTSACGMSFVEIVRLNKLT